MARTIVHRGRKIQVAVDVSTGPRGTTIQRDVVLHPGAVAILPLAAAARELAEETGYRAASWHKLAEFYPSPGVLSEKTVLFVARGLTPGAMRPEDDEQLEPVLVPLGEAMARTLDGTIRDAKTLVALLLWDRLKEESMKVERHP